MQTPMTVPSVRMAAFCSDWPVVSRLIIIAPKAAQYGFSQPMYKAMPKAITTARAVLMDSLVRGLRRGRVSDKSVPVRLLQRLRCRPGIRQGATAD